MKKELMMLEPLFTIHFNKSHSIDSICFVLFNIRSNSFFVSQQHIFI